MKKILLILMLGLFLISLTSGAISELQPVKRGDSIDLIQTCNDCTFNNITNVLFPNGSTALTEVEMAKDGTFYNFTFNNTNTNGIYTVNGFGDTGGSGTQTWNYKFPVTETGFIIEKPEGNFLIVILIVTFILFIAFLIPALRLPYSNQTDETGAITRITRSKYLKLLSSWFAFGFLMWFLQTLNTISTSFIQLTHLSNFITNIFTYTRGITVGVTILMLSIIFIEIWKDIILSDTIKRFGKALPKGKLQ